MIPTKLLITMENCKHIRKKPYKCDVCKYTCTDKSNFTRIHTGEKPYKCSMCSYACNNISNFTKHTRIHTGEKPTLY